MATSVKITQIGNSVGIVLPRETLNDLNVEKGDSLHLIKKSDGVLLTPYSPDFEAKVAVFEEIMRENRDVLRKLAE